jgi:hypothetical protein
VTVDLARRCSRSRPSSAPAIVRLPQAGDDCGGGRARPRASGFVAHLDAHHRRLEADLPQAALQPDQKRLPARGRSRRRPPSTSSCSLPWSSACRHCRQVERQASVALTQVPTTPALNRYRPMKFHHEHLADGPASAAALSGGNCAAASILQAGR